MHELNRGQCDRTFACYRYVIHDHTFTACSPPLLFIQTLAYGYLNNALQNPSKRASCQQDHSPSTTTIQHISPSAQALQDLIHDSGSSLGEAGPAHALLLQLLPQRLPDAGQAVGRRYRPHFAARRPEGLLLGWKRLRRSAVAIDIAGNSRHSRRHWV